jgi:hypothetical protein
VHGRASARLPGPIDIGEFRNSHAIDFAIRALRRRIQDVENVMQVRAKFIHGLIALLAAIAAAPTSGATQTNPSPGLPATPPPSTIDPSTMSPRPGQRPDLSREQRSKIFQAVNADKNKVARAKFPVEIGAEVPPALELYNLPDNALIDVPVAKMFKCVVIDDKVVLVDPTIMRVVEVIER